MFFMIIDSTQTDISTPHGPMRTYVYAPKERAQSPGVILYSEIFQQTEPIKRIALYLAGHGYLVAVPEIFHELETPGTVLGYDTAGAERGNHDKITKTIASYDADTAALVSFFKADPRCSGSIGAFGVCIGGHLAFRAAMHPDIKAAACFYATDIHKRSLGAGMNDNSLDRIPEIKGEMMMIWGRQDPHIDTPGRARVYQALAEANTNFTWHELNGQHAFMRDEGPRYDPELATLGYGLTLSLFARNLRGPS